MIRRLVTCLCLSASVLLGSPVFGQEVSEELMEEVALTSTNHPGFGAGFEVHLGVGVSSYQESVSIQPVESDYDGVVGEVGIRYIYTDRSGYKLRLGGNLWVSDTDTEEWREAGVLVQRNDMEVGGVALTGEFGLDLLNRSNRSLTGWIGIGYRYNDFERSNFQSFDGEFAEDFGSVSEEYDIGTFLLALDGRTELSPKWSLSGEIGLGIAFFNEAQNEIIPGTVEGDGGVLVEVGVHAWYALAENRRIGIGVEYELQELDGAAESRFFLTPNGLIVADLVEWPDNELETVRLDIRWVADL